MPRKAGFEYTLNLRNIMYLLYGSKEKTALFTKPRGKQSPVDISSIKSQREQFLKLHLDISFNVTTNDELYALFKGDIQHGGNTIRSDFVSRIEENDSKNNGSSEQLQTVIHKNNRILNQWIYDVDLFEKTFLDFLHQIKPDFLEKELHTLIEYCLRNNEHATALSWLLIAALLQEKFVGELRRYYTNTKFTDFANHELPLISIPCHIQPFTADSFNPSGNTFVQRADLLNKIQMLYKNGEKAVFLSGMGGVGKSELARSYAFWQRGYFSKILWLVCEDGKKPDLEELLSHSGTQSNLEKLENLPYDSLIIIDNYNTESKAFMKTLLYRTGKSHLLFTTRKTSLYGSKNTLLPVISNDPDHFAYAVFESNYCAESLLGNFKRIEKEDIEAILKICRNVGYHTMTIAMIATELREYDDCTIGMFAEKLNEGLKKAIPDGTLIPFHKDESDEMEDERNLLEILKILFSDLLHHAFSPEEKELLSILSLTPAIEINRKYLCELLGDNEQQKYMEAASRKLIRAGWIKYSDEKISIHPLIVEVMKLDHHHAKILIQEPSFYRHVMCNWLVMDVLKQQQEIFLIQKIKKAGLIELHDPNLYLAIQSLQNGNQVKRLFFEKYSGSGIASYVECELGRIFVYYQYLSPDSSSETTVSPQEYTSGTESIYLDLRTRRKYGRYWKYPEEELLPEKENTLSRKEANASETLFLSATLSCFMHESIPIRLKLPDFILNTRVSVVSDWFASYNPNIISVDFPDYLEEIGIGAFQTCQNLYGELHLPEQLRIIAKSAFENCPHLSGPLHFPEGLLKIEKSAFENCRGLHGQLNFPKSLQEIGEWAFRNCSGLHGDLSQIRHTVKIGLYAFENCPDIIGNEIYQSPGPALYKNSEGKLEFSEEVLSLDDYAFKGCTELRGPLKLPYVLKHIGAYAFKECSGLTGNLNIPEGVIYLGQSAFSDCTGFNGKLLLPDNLSKIGNAAFANCYSFCGELKLSLKLKQIGTSAFKNCKGFTGRLELPPDLEIIGAKSFSGCSGFTEIIIPESVQIIEPAAFAFCVHVTHITILNPYMEITDWITEGYFPTIRGKRNSTAEEYARNWKLPFEYLL